MGSVKSCFSTEDLMQGLKTLNNEMGKDEMLAAFAPITFLSTGGFLALRFLKNRQSTGDLDYLLEPEWSRDNDIKAPLHDAIKRVTRRLNFADDWLNDEMAFFVPLRSRKHLFDEAQKQNIVLWQGKNLRILAVPLEWALERKLRRIHAGAQGPKRGADISDAVALLKHIRDRNGGRLDRERIRTFSMCSYEPPPNRQTMDLVAFAYRRKYKEEVFV
ncbi:hypothetical protein DTO164E3_3119 [Paecilomyces variotii]|nr:hypothetical protein DTO164E3_3119 [Paecilomyces variotii]KAJ9265144.1 hypothetical protein DTO212C5_6818 [Paecilomyces variotii]